MTKGGDKVKKEIFQATPQTRKIEFLRAENKRLLKAIDRLLEKNRQLRSRGATEKKGSFRKIY